MADTIDATIRLAMDQNYSSAQAALQQGFGAAAVRHNNDANFVTATTQLTHQSAIQLVGAEAAGRLAKDSLASSILQQRSAAGQPGNAPDGAK